MHKIESQAYVVSSQKEVFLHADDDDQTKRGRNEAEEAV